MLQSLVIALNHRKIPASIGKKASGLKALSERGYRIPKTWVIPWDVYERYLANEVKMVDDLCAALEGILDPTIEYAIRSSANIEDGAESSYAGQFKTVLRVQGVAAVVQAVWSIWATAQSPEVSSYGEKRGGQPLNAVRMAVIIQEMVSPAVSGVAFSRNPMTGADEIVIEAVLGSGEALVQEGATPLRWAWKWGNWISRPEDQNTLDTVAQRVVEGVRAIGKSFKTHIDLEWVWDGRKITWVQMREITTIADLNVYSNRMAKEMLPGAIKPLIWSINIPLVNSAWIRILDEAVGNTRLKPADLAVQIHFHTYFNMTALGRVFNLMGFPSEGLEIMTGTVPKEAGKAVFHPGLRTILILPRIFLFMAEKWNFAPKMKRFLAGGEESLQAIKQEIQRAGEMDDAGLLRAIDRLFDWVRAAAYYNINGPLLMAMYSQMLKALLKKYGVDYARFDLTEGMSELLEMDPAVHLARLHQAYTRLPGEAQASILEGRLDELRQIPQAQSFCRDFDAFITRFGHLSDSGNDFSVAPWREIPGLILKLIAEQDVREDGKNRVGLSDLHRTGLSKVLFDLIYRRARQFRLFREQISSLYTSAYGQFRYCYLELGQRLAARGVLAAADDIYYLSREEVEGALSENGRDWCGLVLQRRVEMEACRGVILPPVIYGERPPPLVESGKLMLNGTPTSRGYYAGPARVVVGIQDFHKVQAGDVLVIPFSEVSWTPLFVHAGAVVAESGGMLSHSSIIAREYNIPAVVSVAGATRLKDGTKIAVDGYRGLVSVLEE
jgi:pyruvate,water dikinase